MSCPSHHRRNSSSQSVVRRQFDCHSCDSLSCPGITERLEFLLALDLIHRVQISSDSRMAAKFRASGWKLLEDSKQILYADPFRVWQTFVRLPVKLAGIANVRTEITNGDGHFCRQRQHNGPGRFVAMPVLMGINMRGISSHQVVERRHLLLHFLGHSDGIIFFNDLIELAPFTIAISPLPEIEMQTYAQFRVLFSVRGGLRSDGPPYHQAGTSHNSVFMGFDDAAVHSGTLSEVVGVDDQYFCFR